MIPCRPYICRSKMAQRQKKFAVISHLSLCDISRETMSRRNGISVGRCLGKWDKYPGRGFSIQELLSEYWRYRPPAGEPGPYWTHRALPLNNIQRKRRMTHLENDPVYSSLLQKCCYAVFKIEQTIFLRRHQFLFFSRSSQKYGYIKNFFKLQNLTKFSLYYIIFDRIFSLLNYCLNN